MIALALVVGAAIAAGCGPPALEATARAACASATYYVSPQGSDAASGRSPAHPWRTIARAETACLAAGGRLLFRGGGVWRAALQPRWSGTATQPIVIGAYGKGRPWLDGGVYLDGVSDLRLAQLGIAGPGQGIQSSGSGAGVDRIGVHDVWIRDVGIGINAANEQDDGWTIDGSRIERTRDSGVILVGSHMTVRDSTLLATGRSSALTYGKHGVYAKGDAATVTGNTIAGFQSNGISIRRPDAVVAANRISGGPIGIAFFAESSGGGTTRIVDNRFAAIGSVGIYLQGPSDQTFVVGGNAVSGSAPLLAARDVHVAAR